GSGGESPAGVFVFEARVLEHVPESGYQDIKEVLIPRLYRAGERVATYSAQGRCPRVSSPESYLAVNAWMLERMDSPPAGYRRSGEAYLHATAQVDETARLIGPVQVGPDARIGRGALVVGPTV